MPPQPPERGSEPKEAPETPLDEPQPIPIQDPPPTPSEPPGPYTVRPERKKDEVPSPQAGDPTREVERRRTESQKLLEMEANVRQAMGDE
jgi:hypothetical protein